MKKIQKLIADLALRVAKSAFGVASEWTTYQPKEPRSLKELVK